MTCRFVVLIEVDSNNIENAYDKLKDALDNMCGFQGSSLEGWESTEEWFDSDGNLCELSLVENIRLKSFTKF